MRESTKKVGSVLQINLLSVFLLSQLRIVAFHCLFSVKELYKHFFKKEFISITYHGYLSLPKKNQKKINNNENKFQPRAN